MSQKVQKYRNTNELEQNATGSGITPSGDNSGVGDGCGGDDEPRP